MNRDIDKDFTKGEIDRSFVFQLDPKASIHSWNPCWMPNGTPCPSAAIVAHDVIEHVVDVIGFAEGELMARGCQIWGRGQAHWWNKNDPEFDQWPGFIAADLSWLIVNVYNGSETLVHPEWKLAYRGELEANLDRFEFEHEKLTDDMRFMCFQAIEAAAVHLDINHCRLIQGLPSYPVNRMMGYLIQGYEQAQLFYGFFGIDPATLSDMFDDLVEEIELINALGDIELGDRLDVQVNLIEKEVRAELIRARFA